MGRRKKINNVQVEENNPIQETAMTMTQEGELETLQTEIDLARQELERTKLEIEEKKKELQFNERREIGEDEKKIVEKQVTMSDERKSKQSVIEQQKARDNEKVTGKFMNRRNPGQQKKLPYIKYQDDPVKWYTFEEGKVYTIPRGFADQINEHYHKPQFIQKEGAQDPSDGSSIIHDVDTSNKLYAFVPVNF